MHMISILYWSHIIIFISDANLSQKKINCENTLLIVTANEMPLKLSFSKRIFFKLFKKKQCMTDV